MFTSKIKYEKTTTKANCKLAFVVAPEVSSTNNVEVIDLSSNYNISKKNKLKRLNLDEDNKVQINADEFPLIDNRLSITNVYKNVENQIVPLYYKCKLSKPVTRHIEISEQFYLYDTIKNQKATIKDMIYTIVPIKRDDGLFDLYLFFNHAKNIYNRFYMFYKDSEGQIHKEFIHPEFAYYPRDVNHLAGSTLNDFEYMVEKDKQIMTISIKTPVNQKLIYVDFIGYHEITIDKVEGLDKTQEWGVKIKNGYFEIDNVSTSRMKFVYDLKEYKNQLFDTYGPPYMRIKETPKVVGDKVIVSHPCIYDKKEIRITIDDDVFTTEDFLSIDKINGIIHLPKNLSKHDKIEIEYTAIVEEIEYKGYYDFNSRKKIDFNVNPCKGNRMDYITNTGALKNLPVFQLMKKPVYIYLRPSYIYYCDKVINDEIIEYRDSLNNVQVTKDVDYKLMDLSTVALTKGFCVMVKALDNQELNRGTNDFFSPDKVYWTYDNENATTNTKIRIYNSHLLKGQDILFTFVTSNEMKLDHINEYNTVFHTLDKIPTKECEGNGYILLGEVYSFPNSTIDDLVSYDIRQRGGGLIEELEDEIRRIIEPQSDFYWDIGFWDGEELGAKVLSFRFENEVLQENGGTLTLELIRESIEKHMDAGAEYFIEFVDLKTHIRV